MVKYPLFNFTLIQGFLWCLLSLGFFYIKGFPTDVLGLGFSIVFLIGHVFLFAGLLGLLVLPFRFWGPRALQAACIGGGSFFSALLAIDLFIFSQYRFHISLAMLELFFGPARNDIFLFPTSMWVICGASLLLIIGIETALVQLAKRFTLSAKTIMIIAGAWLVCFLTYNGLYAWGQFIQVPSIISQRTTLPLAYPLSANRRLRKWGFEPKKNVYATPHKGFLQYPKHPLTCPPPHKPLNILILLVDAWRADMFTPKVMPRLSAWAARQPMTVFTQHLAGGNSTAGGVFSLFYGLPSSYWDDFTSLNLPPLLVSRALQAGYEPAIFASSKLTSPTFDRNVFAAIPNLRIGSEPGLPWKRDLEAVEAFEHFLHTRQVDKPFLGFIFLDAPHGYSYPQEDKRFTPAKELNYLLLTNRTDPLPYVNQYKNSVYFVDKLIDRTLTSLQQHRLFENTVVLITADHGQELNDSRRNFWGHNSNFTDYQTHVPLLLYIPGHTTPSPKTYRTTHYDIAPTLLQTVFGCTNPATDFSIGYPLFDPTPRPFTVFSGYEEKALRLGDTILVFDRFNVPQQYGPHLEPVTAPPPATLVKDGLKTFSRFYK